MNWKKGMKWIVTVFAVLVLMSAFVGTVSAEKISTITLTGITAPVAGQSPQTSGISADESNLTLGSYEWKTDSGGSVGSSFDYDTVYKLIIPISVKDETNNTLSAASATSNAGAASYADGKVTIIFDKTEANPNTMISGLTLSLSAPVVNQNPSQPSVSGTGVSTSAEISWSPSVTDKFAGDTTYTATVTVSANDNYCFPESPSNSFVTYGGGGTINSVTPKDSLKKLEIVIKFPKTAVPQQETPAPEITSFTPNKTSGTAPLTVSFTFTHKNATSFELKSGATVLETGTASPITHTFTTAGTYTVKLVAINGTKTENSSSVTITVSPAQTLTTLNTVELSIAAPSAGATPASSVSGTGITSKSVTWSPSDSSFKAGTQYKATIKVTNASGYVFPSSKPAVKVNGNSVNADKVSLSGNELTVEYTFSKTNDPISSVSLSVDAPVLGAEPDTTVTPESSAKYDVSSITWYTGSAKAGNEFNVSDTFEPQTVYAVKIKLTADEGYVFNSSMKKESAKVNEKAASEDPTFSNGNKELTLMYIFPATAEAQKPVITLTADPANPIIKSGLDSVTVTFTYKITGGFDSASLNFGDGSSEESITQDGGTKSHTYKSASTFTVTLRAGNENGTTTKTLSLPITKEKFKAAFDASVLSGEAPLKILFTDTSTGTSGKVIQRSWDFDDGTTETSQTSVTHTFEKEGTYYVKLFISDGTNQDTATRTITVTKKGQTAAVPTADIEYEPFIIIGDVGIPSPLDLIAEFIRLFQEMLNFDNYTIFSGEE